MKEDRCLRFAVVMQEFVFLHQASFSRATWHTGASVLYDIPQSYITETKTHTQLV